MSKIDLSGIFPPITTSFENGEVAQDKLASNVQKLSKTGISGFVVLGSNGEGVYLSEPEKLDVIKTVVQATPADMLVIAGTACESTTETIRMTCAAAELGARAALLTTPHYYGGKMTPNALEQFYSMVADAVPIPVLLYNVPKFTHLTLTAGTVGRLSRHPNIVGMKDSSGNLASLGQYINTSNADFKVLVGTASVLFGALSLGCVGGVLALANIAPQACVALYEMTRQGRFADAKEIQLRLIPVNIAITATYGIGGMKAAMDMLGYFGGDPRLPLLPTSDTDKAEIRAILAAADLLPE